MLTKLKYMVVGEERSSTYKYQRMMISSRMIKHMMSAYNQVRGSHGYDPCELDSSATGGDSDGDMVGDKVTGLSASDLAGFDVISVPTSSTVVTSTECLALVLSLDTGLEPLVTTYGEFVTFPACDSSKGTVTFAK